jgi:hypothetical protein
MFDQLLGGCPFLEQEWVQEWRIDIWSQSSFGEEVNGFDPRTQQRWNDKIQHDTPWQG